MWPRARLAATSRVLLGRMISGRQLQQLIRSFFFSSRRRHTSYWRDWSSDVCSSDSQQYQAFFDNKTPVDYDLTAYIKPRNKNMLLYIWGDNAQLYKLTNTLPPSRYVAAYRSEERRVGKECRSRLLRDD